MLDEIGSVTARISEIQNRIAALDGPAALPAPAPAPAPAGQTATDTPTFARTLTAAAAAQAPAPLTGPTTLPPGSPVAAPPASLGPLPGTAQPGDAAPLPVAPGAANVVPLPRTASSDMGGLIQKYAAQNGLEPALVRAVIKTESDGNPRCVSRAGAMGLMQLMPENVKEAGIHDPFDPAQNIAAGTKQLADLMAQYHGNLDLGPGGLQCRARQCPQVRRRAAVHRDAQLHQAGPGGDGRITCGE